MSKIIDFKKHEGKVTASTYYLCRNDIYGKEVYREPFSGDEHIKTTCPKCRQEFGIDIYKFFEIASSEFCFHGAMLFCSDCAAERARQKTMFKEDESC